MIKRGTYLADNDTEILKIVRPGSKNKFLLNFLNATSKGPTNYREGGGQIIVNRFHICLPGEHVMRRDEWVVTKMRSRLNF